MVRRLSIAFTVSLCFLLFASYASANSVDILTFTGLKDGQQVGNYYNGGSGNPNIPNYGITFSSNFFGLHSEFQGGAGAFSPDPSSTPVIFIMGATGSPVTGSITATNGFTSGVNFFYTAGYQETATIWSGANGTGTVLATITLSANDANCTTVSYCNWTNVGLSFTGTAHSLTFSGPANGIGLSDMAFGQSTSIIPEPSSIWLLGTGLAGICAQGMHRFLKG
jgi:hypothetical protein